jgi:hypothetical protein
MTRKVLTLKQTRQAALQGRAEEAVPLLRLYADRGDASAAASLAEPLGFRGEWEECLKRAGAFIARPQSAYAGNVFNDMISLLARAGRETQQWELLLHVTQAAEQRVEENIADDNPPKQAAQRTCYNKIFQGLHSYAERQGATPLDLKQIFGAVTPIQKEQDAAYQLAVQNATQLRPNLRKDPVALSRHRFMLARYYNQDVEGIRFYEDEQMPPEFDCAVFVAKAYARREERERAWEVLWKHTPRWWPLDRAQVAPVDLLLDRDLADLMNRERCEQVLTLPRGPGALT